MISSEKLISQIASKADQIFMSNCLFATFKEKDLEDEYQKNIAKLNWFVKFGICLSYSLGYVVNLFTMLYMMNTKEKKYFISILVSIIIIIEQIFTLFFIFSKNFKIKNLMKYLKLFMFITFSFCWILHLTINWQNEERRIIRNIYLLVLGSVGTYLIGMQNSISLSIFLFFINFSTILCVQMIYMSKVDSTNTNFTFYPDMAAIFIISWGVFIFKKKQDEINRTLFHEKYRSELICHYFNDFLNGLNGYHINLNKTEVIYVNQNFKQKYNILMCENPSHTTNENTENQKITFWAERVEDFLSQLFLKEEILPLFLRSNSPHIDNHKSITFNLNLIVRKIQENNIISSEFKLIGNFIHETEMRFFSVYFRKTLDNDLIDLLINDITEIKQAEKLSNESQIKQKILAKIAHEFKTPLNSIISLISSTEKSIQEKFYENVIANLKQIDRLSQYTIFLINDVIQYASDNLQNLKISFSFVNLEEVMKFSFDILNSLLKCSETKLKSIKHTLEIDERLNNFSVFSDELRLKQILLNFISNSVKFTKAGHIKLSAQILEERNLILVQVVDSGIGIKEEDKKLIFSENMMLNTEHEYNKMGSGLGLSICKMLSKKLNYEISFTSEYNKGTSFNILIPYKSKYDKFTSLSLRNKTFYNDMMVPLVMDKKSKFFYTPKLSIKECPNFFDNLNSRCEIGVDDPKRITLHKGIFSLNSSYVNECISETNELLDKSEDKFLEINKREQESSENNTNRLITEENILNIDYLNLMPLLKDQPNSNANHSQFNHLSNIRSVNYGFLPTLRKSSNVSSFSTILKITKIHRFSFTSLCEKEKQSSGKSSGKILIVDDNHYIRSSIKNLVQQVLKSSTRHYDIVEGSDGVDILKLIIDDQQSNNLFKCIITDENMEYINGSESIKILKDLEKANKIKKILIISITSFEDELTKSNINKAGVDYILSKPCTKKHLAGIFKNESLL
jgi:signal transduction histidine kinase/CheY-like chemotaxis protein